MDRLALLALMARRCVQYTPLAKTAAACPKRTFNMLQAECGGHRVALLVTDRHSQRSRQRLLHLLLPVAWHWRKRLACGLCEEALPLTVASRRRPALRLAAFGRRGGSGCCCCGRRLPPVRGVGVHGIYFILRALTAERLRGSGAAEQRS